MAELGTRPTSDIGWADSGSASVSDPGSAKVDLGWIQDEIPPHDEFNWWMQQAADWIQYLDAGRVRTFDDLEDAASALDYGEFGCINGRDKESNLFDTEAASASITGLTGTYPVVCTDGEYVFAAYNDGGQKVRCWTRDLGTVVWTKTTITGPIRAICTVNDEYIAIADDNTVRLLERADGTLAALNFAHGDDIYALASNGKKIWMAGVVNVYNVRCLDLATMTSDQNITISNVNTNSYWDLVVRGEECYIQLDSTAGNANLWKYNEAGTVLASQEVDDGSSNHLYSSICLTDHGLFVGGGSGDWCRLDPYLLTEIERGTNSFAGTIASWLYDGRYTYAMTADDELYIFDPVNMYEVAEYTQSDIIDASGGGVSGSIACDATGIFFMDTLGDQIVRLDTLHRPMLVQRIQGKVGDATMYTSPYKMTQNWLIAPVDR